MFLQNIDTVEMDARSREHNRLLLLCRYRVYNRPGDRERIEELAKVEGRELYPDEDDAFVLHETPVQTFERWGAAAVRRRRLAVLARAASQKR
jgi:hypothetical protein